MCLATALVAAHFNNSKKKYFTLSFQFILPEKAIVNPSQRAKAVLRLIYSKTTHPNCSGLSRCTLSCVLKHPKAFVDSAG